MTDRQGRLAMRPEPSRRGFLEMAGAGLVAGVSGAMARAAKPAAGMRSRRRHRQAAKRGQGQGRPRHAGLRESQRLRRRVLPAHARPEPDPRSWPVEGGQGDADSQGLFLDAGVGWMNPFNTAERPDIRKFGDGDYRLAVEKMLKAARLIDCTELWAVSAHSRTGGRPTSPMTDSERTSPGATRCGR